MTIYILDYSFPNFEPVHCSISSSNCCFLSCIQVSQEAGKVIWYSHLFKNIPQLDVIHIVKGFSIVNEAEVDVFFFFFVTPLLFLLSYGCWQFDLWFLCLFKIQLVHLEGLIHILLKPSLKDFEHSIASM